MKTGDELLRETEKKYLAKVEKLMEDLEAARAETVEARAEKNHLQKKCDFLDAQLTRARVQGQQAADLVSNRNDGYPGRSGRPNSCRPRPARRNL